MAQANRLIKLFQQKADNALGLFVTLRERNGQLQQLGWTQSDMILAASLKAQMETWAKAAELLRKEELR